MPLPQCTIFDKPRTKTVRRITVVTVKPGRSLTLGSVIGLFIWPREFLAKHILPTSIFALRFIFGPLGRYFAHTPYNLLVVC